ncbi:MAG TPA: GNAT family N-acetyltransferase [Candidatus Dormibacteraeota bacterium]|nr:GNAT family N-acetyltransferase [Candidatus Dormibacteraeota bacterium]
MASAVPDPPRAVAIRRATVADVGEVAELFALYRVFYGEAHDVAAAAAFLRARLEHDQSTVYLAQSQDGAVVGFAQVYPTFASVELAPAWRLNDLYVLETARGQGVAALLLRAVREGAQDAGAVWIDLETARGNVKAQRLYEREGYTRDDEFLHYVTSLDAPRERD